MFLSCISGGPDGFHLIALVDILNFGVALLVVAVLSQIAGSIKMLACYCHASWRGLCVWWITKRFIKPKYFGKQKRPFQGDQNH